MLNSGYQLLKYSNPALPKEPFINWFAFHTKKSIQEIWMTDDFLWNN